MKKKNVPISTSSASKAKPKIQNNPFEVHINRKKFEILGKKSKDDYGLPGVSRGKAYRKREKTLLVQYKNRHKNTKFIDKRIGDKNKALDPERIELLRANVAAKHTSKKNLYNLNDDEELTHGGKALDEFVMKERGAFSDEEEDGGLLDADYVQDQHFGGDSSSRPNSYTGEKTRQEWIDDMVAESKRRKEMSKREREEHSEAVERLDANYRGFLSLLKGKGMTDEDKDKSKATCEFRDYDMLVREIAFSRSKRAEPTSRLKTEEELARDEKERLQKLEEERLRRMRGEEKSYGMQSADALDFGYDISKKTAAQTLTPYSVSDAHVNILSATKRTGKKATKSDDGDSEEVDSSDNSDEEESAAESDEESGDEEEAATEDDDSENEVGDEEQDTEESSSDVQSENEEIGSGEQNAEELSSGEQSDDELPSAEQHSGDDDDESVSGEQSVVEELSSGDELLDDDDAQSSGEQCSEVDVSTKQTDRSLSKGLHARVKRTGKSKSLKSEATLQSLNAPLSKRSTKKKSQTVEEELPYTFDVPEDYDGFWDLLQGRSPPQVCTIIERMVACNHPKLCPENRSKANAIFAYLLQTLHIICSPDPEQIRDDVHPLNYVNCFIPHLYALTHINPPDCAAALLQVIDEKYEEYNSKPKRTSPFGDTLIFLKLSGLLFPASDFQHDVMTRVMVFLSHILGEAKVYSGRDVVTLLFTSNLLFEYLKMSCRFVGELVNTLVGILSLAIPPTGANILKSPTFKAYGEAAHILVLNKSCKSSNTTKLKFANLNEEIDITSEVKVQILNDALKLLSNITPMWRQLSSVRALFAPASKLVEKIPLANYPEETKTLVRNFQKEISNLPGQLLHLVKPELQKSLRMFEPKYETIYDGDKKGVEPNPLHEKRHLIQTFKKERKGAKRELKKDAQFLARNQLKDVLAGDAERKRKVNLIMHGLETQESEYQKMKKMSKTRRK